MQLRGLKSNFHGNIFINSVQKIVSKLQPNKLPFWESVLILLEEIFSPSPALGCVYSTLNRMVIKMTKIAMFKTAIASLAVHYSIAI